jgi:hypothetical protein
VKWPVCVNSPYNPRGLGAGSSTGDKPESIALSFSPAPAAGFEMFRFWFLKRGRKVSPPLRGLVDDGCQVPVERAALTPALRRRPRPSSAFCLATLRRGLKPELSPARPDPEVVTDQGCRASQFLLEMGRRRWPGSSARADHCVHSGMNYGTPCGGCKKRVSLGRWLKPGRRVVVREFSQLHSGSP